MTLEPSIGAFYSCYKRPKAVESALSSFRSFYPNSTIYMVSDGGDDLSMLAQKYNAKFTMEQHAGNGTSTVFSDSEKMLVWFRRLYKAAEAIQEDYIVILEDDVLTLGRVREQLKFIVNGINPNVKIGRRLTLFLKLCGARIQILGFNQPFGGFGGCIFDRRFILGNFKNLENDVKKLYSVMKENVYSTDIWSTIITLYHGGTVGPYKGLCEKWYPDYEKRRKKGDISFLHQYKDLYI